ncbi:MAG: flagellar export protein FliJ [Treponema sp.]|nr:flagellar export protein FliJ [Treponema sp.]
MKPFKFELEDVLSLRKFEQEQAQIELGKAVSEETKIQNNLKLLAVQHAKAKQDVRGRTDFSVISQGQQYFSFLKLQEEKLLEDLAEAKLVTEAKREVFRKCLQKTQSLEKLKEKQKEIYTKAEEKEMEEAIDETISARRVENNLM